MIRTAVQIDGIDEVRIEPILDHFADVRRCGVHTCPNQVIVEVSQAVVLSANVNAILREPAWRHASNQSNPQVGINVRPLLGDDIVAPYASIGADEQTPCRIKGHGMEIRMRVRLIRIGASADHRSGKSKSAWGLWEIGVRCENNFRRLQAAIVNSVGIGGMHREGQVEIPQIS
ncbi:hypothetical protein HRbin36_01209 [bacterium HR36]|nr:hypothetical protein HRbin36_01209 [bacterium HR36]